MRLFVHLFFALAVGGFCASALVHLLALAGREPPGGMAVMGLHIGIFVVFIPAVILGGRIAQGGTQGKMPFASSEWVKWTTVGLFVYAFVNFFLGFMDLGSKATPFRLFSGHWMLFYFIAAAMLDSYLERTRPERLCPNRHRLAPKERECPRCGLSVDGPVSV